MTELIADNFCGGGGASAGIEMGLGRGPNLANNHNRVALAMHEINHPQAVHLCEDVFKVDILQAVGGRRVGFAWFSPDCRHFSKAKGGVPLSKKIRGLAWSAVKWAAKVRPRGIVLENVEEFEDWGPLVWVTVDGQRKLVPCPVRKGRTFQNFVAQLRRLGYAVEWRELAAHKYGAPTMRNRLYLIARCDGRPIIWPEPTHARPAEAARLGLKPWRTFAECCDFKLPCPSIFLSAEEGRKIGVKRPLVPNTHRRLARGVKRYVMDASEPFVLCMTHFLTEHANGSSQRNFSAIEPLRTQCGEVKGGHFALSACHVARQFGTTTGQPVDSPLVSVMPNGGGGKCQWVASFLAQHNGGMVGHDVRKPCSAIVGRGSQQQLGVVSLVKYYGTDQDPRLDRPAGTVTTKDRFGLSESLVAVPPLTPELAARARQVAEWLHSNGIAVPGEFATTRSGLVIYDIGMRMLTPRELYRAQGFPEDYVIDRAWIGEGKDRRLVLLSKSDQVRMCGNSVSPPVAAAIVSANFPELSVRRREAAAA